jgi:hypothetical protein
LFGRLRAALSASEAVGMLMLSKNGIVSAAQNGSVKSSRANDDMRY